MSSRRSVRSRSRARSPLQRVRATAKTVRTTKARVGAVASPVRHFVTQRTTRRACPYCPGRKTVPLVDWEHHYQGHILWAKGEGKRKLREQHEAGVRARQGAATSRPVNPEKRPSSTTTPVTPRSPSARYAQAVRDGTIGQRPSTVHIVEDDGPPPIPIVDPDTPVEAGPSRGARLRQWMFPTPATPTRTGPGDGTRWRTRTTNPGGNPRGTRPPAPGQPDNPPIASITPIGAPPVTTPTATGTGRPRPTRKASTGSTGPSTGGGGGGDLGEAFMGWARSAPETLAQAKHDSQKATEGLAAIGDALRHRMEAEVDRSIAASCVEPYQDAMQSLQRASEQVQEVYRRLHARYGETAEFLARPDTPDPGYLKDGT